MTDRARVLILSIAALLVAAACGGAAAQEPPTPTTTPAAATLPASTAAAATLAPASPPAASATTAAKTTAPATSSAPSDLIAEGKIVFTTIGPSGKGCQECHGANARGSTATDGTTAPSIVGASETKLRNALAGSAALMTNLKLTDRQIEAVLAYLAYLDNQ